jgi:hypothetical protein
MFPVNDLVGYVSADLRLVARSALALAGRWAINLGAGALAGLACAITAVRRRARVGQRSSAREQQRHGGCQDDQPALHYSSIFPRFVTHMAYGWSPIYTEQPAH